MKPAEVSDNRSAAMIHLLNMLCATVLIYVTVTRGALTVAWTLKRLTRKTSA
jgi:hypothetical protein